VQFSLIVPCYNEEEALPHLLDAVTPLLEKEIGLDWEIIFVNDGSQDRTLDLILRSHQRDGRIKGVSLSRNFGHQPAVACGLAFASGRFVGLMDCDLQDAPEALIQLYRRVRDEGYDVCYAVRRRRRTTWLKRICYKTFYSVMRVFSEHPFPENAGDFSVFNRSVQQALLALPETVRVLRGLRSWIGFRQCEIAVDRPERRHGTTKYTWWRLVSLGISSLTGFSYVPLRLASLLGFGMGCFSLLLGGLFLLNRLFPEFTLLSYYVGANPGTTTIILYVSIISSLLFFCLGIMGEYLVVMLKELKRRPTAIAQLVIGDLQPHPSTSVLSVTDFRPVQ
jgi:glycosyltransferase involved in cell wall biosynthesis